MYEDQEVAKWRKKRSRQSKVERRSDHKHNYAPACRVIGDEAYKLYGFYCTTCMKWKSGPWLYKAEDRSAWEAAHPNMVYVKLNSDHTHVIDFIKKL